MVHRPLVSQKRGAGFNFKLRTGLTKNNAAYERCIALKGQGITTFPTSAGPKHDLFEV